MSEDSIANLLASEAMLWRALDSRLGQSDTDSAMYFDGYQDAMEVALEDVFTMLMLKREELIQAPVEKLI